MVVPLPFDEFFPKLPLAKGDREMKLPELAAQAAKLRAEGKGPKDYYRFEVEWHKKFAISAACLVFGLLGLALSLGSRKEARSGAFGLSIVVIFIYYVLIRMGEQAGDTGLMAPALAMWGANLVLGGVAVALLLLNQKAAAFDPLDPRQYLAWLPRLRRRPKAEAEPSPGARPAGRPLGAGRGRREARGGGAADPPHGPALPHPPRPLRGPHLPGPLRPRGRGLLGHLRPGRVHGPLRRRAAEQGQGPGGLPLLRLPRPLDRPLPGPPGRAGGGAGRLRDPEPAQRDHRHEGGRDQPLPGRLAGGDDRPAHERHPVRDAGARAPLHEPHRGHGLQRHQGTAAPVLEPARPALDPGLGQPLLQLRLPLGAQGGGGRGRRAGAARLLALRPARLRRRPRGLGAARRALRRPGGLERPGLRPRARVAAGPAAATGLQELHRGPDPRPGAARATSAARSGPPTP